MEARGSVFRGMMTDCHNTVGTATHLLGNEIIFVLECLFRILTLFEQLQVDSLDGGKYQTDRVEWGKMGQRGKMGHLTFF